VPQQDPHAAARQRDLGLRKIGRLTWRAGLAGAACSAVMALAFGHHTADAASSSSNGTGGGSSSSSSPTTHSRDGGSIVIPGQPPQPASGPSQVTSGGTSTHVP
jgi:hypothetical protein